MTEAGLHILIALAEGEKHGYAIMREINDGTKGRVKLYPGTLYATIKRLLEERLIEELRQPDAPGEDERRRLYRLTRRGRSAAIAELTRLQDIVRSASLAFKGGR